MKGKAIQSAIASVPAGAWAVGVSGGADSVALLMLLCEREDLALHVVHLDHQTRGEASTGDAQFVEKLAGELELPCTVALREKMEADLHELPANPSARYRAVRMALFGQVVQQYHLKGVILAHHGDDQAETVLHRLLRGSGPRGLGGIAFKSVVQGVTILRPLLRVSREDLRRFLVERGQGWREDASNESEKYFRNRLRKLLAGVPQLTGDLQELGEACQAFRQWVHREAPKLADEFEVGQLQDVPRPLAEESARRWLVERGVPADQIVPDVIDRLMQMAEDAASPARQHFPGRVLVSRRKGKIAGKPEV